MHAMVNEKKMTALKALIKAMFDMEADGDGDKAIDPTQALHEASETPEEEEMEHEGGISELEENMKEPDEDDDFKSSMAKFMKQSRQSAPSGRTKAVIMATKAENPVGKFGGMKK